ncbi:MAG: 16S rRNA (guanine(527)-N(7))-methyltransferase RsmG [Bacteroidales bacterium]|nr:16S rRNA (guanine(527)-N(7))-methyltransferase RsmG [Bacteroidales bacterium]
MQAIKKYFPDLSSLQYEQLGNLGSLYSEWNTRINVISRKDIENLYEHHVLHSLAIAKVIQFKKDSSIMDAGTGGGFPGIPLAIIFPDSNFHLIDSVRKKIKVVQSIYTELKLKNIIAQQYRIEEVNNKFDFIISRAVTSLPLFHTYVKNKIAKKSFNDIPNGILYLKGGDFKDEIKKLNKKHSIYELHDFFNEEYFQTKKLIHIY